jgi:hypothetical protein
MIRTCRRSIEKVQSNVSVSQDRSCIKDRCTFNSLAPPLERTAIREERSNACDQLLSGMIMHEMEQTNFYCISFLRENPIKQLSNEHFLGFSHPIFFMTFPCVQLVTIWHLERETRAHSAQSLSPSALSIPWSSSTELILFLSNEMLSYVWTRWFKGLDCHAFHKPRINTSVQTMGQLIMTPSMYDRSSQTRPGWP